MLNFRTQLLYHNGSVCAKGQNGEFGSEMKRAKNIQKTTLQPHSSYCIQKAARKNIQSSRNDKILRGVKGGHFARVIVRQNGQSGSEIKKAKNHSPTILQLFYTKDDWKKHPTIEK